MNVVLHSRPLARSSLPPQSMLPSDFGGRHGCAAATGWANRWTAGRWADSSFSRETPMEQRLSFYRRTIGKWIPDRQATILIGAGGMNDRNIFFELGFQ